MRLVTYRRGRAAARVGALADDVVFDLAALAADRASERAGRRPARPRWISQDDARPDPGRDRRVERGAPGARPRPRAARPRGPGPVGRAPSGLAARARATGGAHPPAGSQRLLPRPQLQ